MWDLVWQPFTSNDFPLCNRTHQQIGHFSFSDILLYSGVSSVHVTSSSGDVLKSLPSGQFIITPEIPRQLGFPIRADCVITATHLLRCMIHGGNSPFEHPAQNRQSGCPKELLFGSTHFQSCLDIFICCQYLLFSWNIASLGSSLSLIPKP